MSEFPVQLTQNRRTSAFERRVAVALEPHLESAKEAGELSGEPLVVACSGGPDSIATLVAVSRAAPSSTIVAAHFDHGLRPRADTEADAAFVGGVASLVGACAIVGAPEAALAGDEASAREARYRWLASVLTQAGSRVLLTGHTRDDQAETVLLNLARGTGLRGAAGMRLDGAWPVPVQGSARFRVLRPLLGRSRVEVEDYLDALSLEPRLDSTNELTTYARNRVRLEALPALATVNPQVQAHLAAFAERAHDADAAIQAWAAAELEAHGTAADGCVQIDRRRLTEVPTAVAAEMLVLAAARIGLQLDSSQLRALPRLAARRGARLDLDGGTARTDGSSVILARTDC